MSIYKRGKVYWYKFSFLGKTYQASTRLKNEREATKVESKLKTDLALGLYGLQPMKPGPTFRDYAESFREYVKNHTANPQTIRMYGDSLKRLVSFKPLAACRLNFIDEALIEDYIRYQRSRYAVATLNADLRALRRALKVARRYLKVMTAAPEVSTLPGEHVRDFVLSYTQEAAYLVACSDLMRDAAILMLDTGLRVGEACRVKWADFNADRTSLNATDTERFSPRVLGVSRRCREMLANRRLFLPEAAYVFPGRTTHAAVRTLERWHGIARRNARLEDGSELPAEFVVHSLRHTFGTRFGEIEPNAFITMAAMGHGDVSTTQIYVHARQAVTDAAFERLDALNRLMRKEENGGIENRDSSKTPHAKH